MEKEIKVKRSEIALGECECPFCNEKIVVQYTGYGITKIESEPCTHTIRNGEGIREEEMFYPTLIFSEGEHGREVHGDSNVDPVKEMVKEMNDDGIEASYIKGDE